MFLKSAFKPLAVFLVLAGYYVQFPDERNCRKIGTFTIALLFCLSGIAENSCFAWNQAIIFADIIRRGTTNIDDLIIQFIGLIYNVNILFLAVFQTISTTRHLGNSYTSLQTYMDKHGGGKLALRLRTVRFIATVAITAVLLAWVLLLVMYLNIKLSSLGCADLPLDCVWDLLYSAWVFYRNFLYMATPLVLYFLCWLILLTEEFRFNQDFSTFTTRLTLDCSVPGPVLQKCSTSNGSSTECVSPTSDYSLERFRCRYVALCKLMDKATSVLCHFLLMTYAVGIPLALFALRCILCGKLDNKYTFLIAFIMAYHCSVLVAVTIAGAILSAMARRPAELLHQLNLETLSEKDCHTVSIFLARVQGPPVGFSVGGMFTIDTSTILMVLGTVVTYMVIILQLQSNTGPSSGSSDIDPGCPCFHTTSVDAIFNTTAATQR